MQTWKAEVCVVAVFWQISLSCSMTQSLITLLLASKQTNVCKNCLLSHFHHEHIHAIERWLRELNERLIITQIGLRESIRGLESPVLSFEFSMGNGEPVLVNPAEVGIAPIADSEDEILCYIRRANESALQNVTVFEANLDELRRDGYELASYFSSLKNVQMDQAIFVGPSIHGRARCPRSRPVPPWRPFRCTLRCNTIFITPTEWTNWNRLSTS